MDARAVALRAALVAVLACAGPVPAAHAGNWSPMSREQALARIQDAQLDKRRLAYGRLAEVGTMDDTPVLLAALWDGEELIRGIAEQSLWGIWLRADDPVADPLFQTGLQLMQEGDAQAALAKFDEVLVIKPAFAEAWNRRGDAHVALDGEDAALADYGRALALNAYHFGALQSCGEIWLARGDYRKAADYFRRALELNPNLPDTAGLLEELEKKLENDRI